MHKLLSYQIGKSVLFEYVRKDSETFYSIKQPILECKSLTPLLSLTEGLSSKPNDMRHDFKFI